MKATKEEIDNYIKSLFMVLKLDFDGYLALEKLKQKCLEKGEIIFISK